MKKENNAANNIVLHIEFDDFGEYIVEEFEELDD